MELKRDEIIKALECCIETQCENCCNLGNWHEQWNCMTDIMRKALSLIKELTEKYENLEMQFREIDHECDRLEIRNEELTEENERLSAYNENLIKANTYFSNHLLDEVEQAKDLAISCTVREYREQLHRAFAHSSSKDKFNKEVFLEMADLIAKEMIENG